MKEMLQNIAAFTLIATCALGVGVVSCKKASRNPEAPFNNLTLDIYDSYTDGDANNYCPYVRFNFSGHLTNQQCNNVNNFDLVNNDDDYSIRGQQIGLCEFKAAVTDITTGVMDTDISTIPILFDCGTGNVSLFPFLNALDSDLSLLDLDLDCNAAGDLAQVDITCNIGTELYTISKIHTCLAEENC